MSTKVFTFLILCFTFAAFADDFKTLNGKEYNDATVTRVDPDGIVLKTKSGITKVYFPELPKEIRERFHYDSEKAAAYAAEQSAHYATYQKQQEETHRQQADADAKNRAILAEQQAATNRSQAMQTRYADLQKQEDQLLLQIGEAKRPVPEYREGKSLRHRPNPLASQLPLLQSHLNDVRQEKKQVRKQLEKAQHQ
jgi:chromosome segregation ATPase